MQLTIDLGYDQIFQLVRQLSPSDKERLFHESSDFATPMKIPEPEMSDEEYYEFAMNFPVISEEEIGLMLEAKKEVDKCRPILL
jgi:hypothetical protein